MSKDYIKDPFEQKIATVAHSSISNSGEGIFLVKDTPEGSTVSIFSRTMKKYIAEYNEACVDPICHEYCLNIDFYDMVTWMIYVPS